METIDLYKREYSWFLMTYSSPLEFQKLLEHKDTRHFAWISHDKDDNEPHYHIALTLTNQKSLSMIRKIIDSNQNTFGEKLINRVLAYDYLTHKDKLDKYQYSADDIVCDDIEFWTHTKKTKEEENLEFLDDLIKLSYVEMAVKYGRDYIRYFNKYNEFRETIVGDSHKDYIKKLSRR